MSSHEYDPVPFRVPCEATPQPHLASCMSVSPAPWSAALHKAVSWRRFHLGIGTAACRRVSVRKGADCCSFHALGAAAVGVAAERRGDVWRSGGALRGHSAVLRPARAQRRPLVVRACDLLMAICLVYLFVSSIESCPASQQRPAEKAIPYTACSIACFVGGMHVSPDRTGRLC